MKPISRRSRLSATASSVALLVFVSAGMAVAGCAADKVDPAKTEIALRFDVEEATGTKIDTVSCPSDVAVIVGDRFSCTVTASDGVEALAEVEILTEDADLKVLRLVNP